MVNLPQPFPVPVRQAIASYNWVDFAEGTGIVSFYAFRTRDSSAHYKLTSQQPFTEQRDILSEGGNHTTAEVDLTTNPDIDFDLSSFNIPKTIKGTMRCQLPLRYAGGNGIYTVQVKLRKWDGTTETEIGDVSRIFAATDGSANFTVMDITVPRTHFKKGDTLRISIITTSASSLVYLGISPQNQDTTHLTVGTSTPTTTCKFDVPFEIRN